MPHLVYKGTADLAAVCAAFKPGKTESGGWILRIPQIYLASYGRALLAECTAVRSGFVQTFYALVEQKGGSLTIRVDPPDTPVRVTNTVTPIRANTAPTRWLMLLKRSP